jgi:putative ABC transport system permease protein
MIKADDIFRISMRQVVRTRPLAATLSIAFGIAAFIALGVLGQEIREKLNRSFLLMGGVNLMRVVMDDERYPGSPPRYFKETSVEKLRKLDNVDVASASASWSQPYNQTIGRYQYPLRLIGIDQYYARANYLDIEAGENLSADDMEQGNRVALLGHQAAVEIYGSPQKALGRYIYISRNDTAEIIGVLNGPLMGDATAWAFAPYTMTLGRGLNVKPKLDRLYILAQSWETIPQLAEAITKCIQENQKAPHVAVRYAEAQFERIRDTFFWLSFLLWMAIALSLLLGGFGIWSGTFAAVRGRTHEIGLEKAMGATNRDIMNLFLSEALIKAVLGGLIGLVLGIVGVAIGVGYLESSFPFGQLLLCAVGSLLFSALLGISGGIYPAARASRMDVVDSLRFE